MTNETMRHAMAKASGADVDSPDEVIVSKLEANSDPSLTFHQACGAAKDLADYHKPDWNRAQSKHEAESWTMSGWLEIVRAAPGRVDIRDADRPETNPLTKAFDDLGLNDPEPATTVIDAAITGALTDTRTWWVSHADGLDLADNEADARNWAQEALDEAREFAASDGEWPDYAGGIEYFELIELLSRLANGRDHWRLQVIEATP